MNTVYTQASLQDFIDCPRRYQLRYLQRRLWPAVESDPILENERMMQQGARFHKLVQQDLLGVPRDDLTAQVHDPDLGRWWANFTLAVDSGNLAGLNEPSSQRWSEVGLSASLAGARLNAQCDLVINLPDDRLVVYDWKTSRKRPRREWLAARLQTRVYRYLLARAGAHLNQGKPVPPEKVDMVYWFADFPDNPERYSYSLVEFQADERYLADLIQGIAGRNADDFPLTASVERCRFCVYRSLCARGVEAGALSELDSELELQESGEYSLDFEQIAEIPF